MRKVLFALVGVLLSSTAYATDLPKATLKAAAIAPVAPWAGCYATMEAASVGGNGVSGSPGAGGAAECWGQNGALVYSMGIDMLFTKLLTPVALSSPMTATIDAEVGYAAHPGLGTVFGSLPLNDLLLYAGAALPGTLINSPTGSSMDMGWQAKGGIVTALSYTPTGQVQTFFGPEFRWTRVDGRDAQTWMLKLGTRM